MKYSDDPSVARDNLRIMELLSRYLTDSPAFVQPDMMAQLIDCGVDSETAYALLLSAAMGLDTEENAQDRALYHAYFPRMLRRLRREVFAKNPYYRNIRIRPARQGDCTLETQSYAPYEAFVCDDIVSERDGRRIPQIGYFEQAFPYPALLENGRLWMSVTPNEIATMAEPVAQARGRVLVNGLGLGYFAYMVSCKPEVSAVTVVELNPHVIALFEACILPQFPHRDKLSIVRDDAFAFARTHAPEGQYDFIFTDLWHDVSDGLPMYLAMQALSALAPQAVHAYWIEKTLRCYLP